MVFPKPSCPDNPEPHVNNPELGGSLMSREANHAYHVVPLSRVVAIMKSTPLAFWVNDGSIPLIHRNELGHTIARAVVELSFIRRIFMVVP